MTGKPPIKLELIKYVKTSYIYSVSWRKDGNIILSSPSDPFIDVRSGTDLKLIEKINVTRDVFSAYSVGGQLITKMNNGALSITYIGTESNPKHTLLHEYMGPYRQFSVSDSMIADIDYASKQLMIYTITGNHLYNIDINDMSYPRGVHIPPAGDSVFLSGGESEGEVRKYELQARRHHLPVWRCTGLTHPGGIATDQSGNIYVVHGEKIYQISPQGKYVTVCRVIM